jgi:hypothetical protein
MFPFEEWYIVTLLVALCSTYLHTSRHSLNISATVVPPSPFSFRLSRISFVRSSQFRKSLCLIFQHSSSNSNTPNQQQRENLGRLILSSFLIVDRQYFSTRQPIFLSSFINTFPQQSAFNLSPPTKSPHKQHQLTTFLSCLFQYQHHPLSLTHNGPRRIQRIQQRGDDEPSGKPRSRRVQPAHPARSRRLQLSKTQLARSQETAERDSIFHTISASGMSSR